MNKRMQYLVEGITKDIIVYLMEDGGYDLPSFRMKLPGSILRVRLMCMKY